MGDSGKKDAKSLVSAILSQVPGPAGSPSPAAKPEAPPAVATEPAPTAGAAGVAGATPTLPTGDEPGTTTSGATTPNTTPAGTTTPGVGAARSVLSKLGGMDTKSLVDAALAGPSAAPQPEAAPAELPASPEEAEADTITLIEVYFDTEEPAERDALLEELCRIKLPVVTEFFKAVLVEDEDDYVRATVAAELARRGEKEGLEAIEADLEDPEEPFFFENALKTLCEIRGVGFYDTLKSMWQDPECDGDKRRDVMLGMEMLDLNRALTDFVGMIEATVDIDTMQDDQIEVAMMAFLRHNYREALPALQGLKSRILQAALDPEEQQELAEFVQEGIDLLETPLEEG